MAKEFIPTSNMTNFFSRVNEHKSDDNESNVDVDNSPVEHTPEPQQVLPQQPNIRNMFKSISRELLIWS